MGLMEALKRVKEAFTGRAQSEEAAAVEEISTDEAKAENEGIQEATEAPESVEDNQTEKMIEDMAAGKDISGYELTEEQKEALAAAGQQLVEAFKPIGEAIVKAFEPVVETLVAVAKEIEKLNLDEWELQKLEESNNHRRMHGKSMIRKRAIIRARKLSRRRK